MKSARSPEQRVVGAVLAGGASRRMGRDKAGVVWRGDTTLGELAEAALDATCDVTVVLGHGQGMPARGGRIRLEDGEPGGGPLQAIAALLQTGLGTYYVILPCDMPGLNADVLRALIDAAAGHDGAMLVDEKGRPQPLPLCLSADVSEVVAGLVDRGERRVGAVRQAVSLVGVAIPGQRHGVLRNVNSPDDVRASPLTTNSTPDLAVHNAKEEQTRQGASDEISATDPHRMGMAKELRVKRVGPGLRSPNTETDTVAVEAPLQILLGPVPIAVLMRTPGHEEELVTGFLLSERIIASSADLADVAACDDVELPAARGHVVRATLNPGVSIDVSRVTRNTLVGSSCGICGQASIERALAVSGPVIARPSIASAVLVGLPQKLRAAQDTFALTGGLHAATLFDAAGSLLVVREDVGRHNAVDKVLGFAARSGLDASTLGLFVSGRISFEIVQKAMAGRVGVVAGVSAPTSLAVELAGQGGVQLFGFVRGGRATRYEPLATG